ncbi:MAG: thioredoxin family protein [Hydrogenobacter sp.]
MRKLILLWILTLFIASCSKNKENINSAQIKDITPKSPYNLLIVESESCIYCKQLDKDLRENETLKKALTGIDIYKLVYESNAKVKYKLGKVEGVAQEDELVRMLGVNSFPYLIFYDKDGQIILRIPGYMEPKTFACVADYIKDNQYKRKSLQEYLKDKCA